MKFIHLSAVVGIAGLLGACSQPETLVAPEPMFDKYGGGSCSEGYVYIPGTAQRPPECIPDDGCIPTVNADGSVEECPPPYRRPDSDGNDSSSTGSGTSTPGTPPTGSTAPIT